MTTWSALLALAELPEGGDGLVGNKTLSLIILFENLMKKLFALIALTFLMLCHLEIKAQSNMEDVIHLKNGYIYRGLIIEKDSIFKIKMSSGFIASIDSASIDSITSESKLPEYDRNLVKEDRHFNYKEKGGFLDGHLILGFYDFGIGIAGGYRFHRFAQFGISVDIKYSAPITEAGSPLGRGYVPFYLQYGGDILKKKYTPTYWLQFGYALSLRPNVSRSDFESTDHEHRTGGYAGGIGFGARYYSPYSIFCCSWTVGFNILHASYHEWGSTTSKVAGTFNYDYKSVGYVSTIMTKVTFGF